MKLNSIPWKTLQERVEGRGNEADLVGNSTQLRDKFMITPRSNKCGRALLTACQGGRVLNTLQIFILLI